MADEKPLSDIEAHDRLLEAREALGEAPGATVHAATALSAARIALSRLAGGLLLASERGTTDPYSMPPPPSPE
jgi:hypothetical protein